MLNETFEDSGSEGELQYCDNLQDSDDSDYEMQEDNTPQFPIKFQSNLSDIDIDASLVQPSTSGVILPVSSRISQQIQVNKAVPPCTSGNISGFTPPSFTSDRKSPQTVKTAVSEDIQQIEKSDSNISRILDVNVTSPIPMETQSTTSRFHSSSVPREKLSSSYIMESSENSQLMEEQRSDNSEKTLVYIPSSPVTFVATASKFTLSGTPSDVQPNTSRSVKNQQIQDIYIKFVTTENLSETSNITSIFPPESSLPSTTDPVYSSRTAEVAEQSNKDDRVDRDIISITSTDITRSAVTVSTTTSRVGGDSGCGGGTTSDEITQTWKRERNVPVQQKKVQRPSDTELGWECSGRKPMSIVDNFWELNDPNPDIHGLFLEFNSNYFWNQLNGVEVKWSSRMTLCAGICVYEGHGGLCSIRLSLPLLKLRPRKDLVETLLHEMIHAYLFVTRNNRDHDGHGPEFCKHMHRINKLTGANITIYHNFRDEVDSYRQHWWRCNGPCRKKPPFYGIVRRAMNRAPSSYDPWWAEHEKTCGGVFQKIKEPPKNDDKRKPQEGNGSSSPKKSKVESADIRTYFTPGLKNGIEKAVKKSFDIFKRKPYSENTGPNIQTINNQTSKTQKVPVAVFQGKGNILGSVNKVSSSKASKLLSLYQSNKNSDKPDFQLDCSSTSLKVSSKIFSTPESVKSMNDFSSFSLSNITTRKKHSSTSKLHNALPNQNITKSEVINLTDSPNLPGKKIRSATISTASPLNHLKDILDDSPPVFPLFKNSPSSQKKCEASAVKDEKKKVPQIDLTSCEVLVKCPVCSKDVINSEINSHLDNCLSTV